MKSMIYYPGFEAKSESWLKFALLYFEELRPIIPYMNAERSQYLSWSVIYTIDNTDLIVPYNPTFEDGKKVSIRACE